MPTPWRVRWVWAYRLSYCFRCNPLRLSSFFFFNDTATTEIYTLSLHDALPICLPSWSCAASPPANRAGRPPRSTSARPRSEEHTSELQSRSDLVCRLLLEKKKKTPNIANSGKLHASPGAHL